jgi:hypothetical protein
MQLIFIIFILIGLLTDEFDLTAMSLFEIHLRANDIMF